MKFIPLHEVVESTTTHNSHLVEIAINRDMIKAMVRVPHEGAKAKTKVDLVGGNSPLLVTETIEEIQILSEDIMKIQLLWEGLQDYDRDYDAGLV